MTIKRELRDELGVPGQVVAWFDRRTIIKRSRELLDTFEAKGWLKMDQVPESKEKDEFREILKSLSLNVQF